MYLYGLLLIFVFGRPIVPVPVSIQKYPTVPTSEDGLVIITLPSLIRLWVAYSIESIGSKCVVIIIIG